MSAKQKARNSEPEPDFTRCSALVRGGVVMLDFTGEARRETVERVEVDRETPMERIERIADGLRERMADLDPRTGLVRDAVPNDD